MNRFSKTLALCLFGVSLSAAGHAARLEQVDTLNCFGNGTPDLNLPVYAYTFSTTTTSTNFFNVFVAKSQFVSLFDAMLFGNGYFSCSLASMPSFSFDSPTLEEVTLAASGIGVDVEVNANGTVKNAGSQYTGAIFSYTTTTQYIGLAKRSVAAHPLTPEEKRAALLAFKATIVQPKN